MSIELEQYLNNGIERLVKDALKATLKNPRQSSFFLQFAAASHKAAKHRHEFELCGEHIPSFLIASITNNCNLHCAGCYARANSVCDETRELPAVTWKRIFSEAEDAGVSVILLAGGEPLTRRDVLDVAAEQQGLLFPVFTNGTLLNKAVLRLFDAHSNLVPIISLEGDAAATDFRRGQGVYIQIAEAMRLLRQYGVSVDFHEIEKCQSMEDWEKGAAILSDVALRLEKAGADFVVICTNTMHKVADEISKTISIPILHIADMSAIALKDEQIVKAALLGTKYTMEQDFYRSRLLSAGIEVIIPDENDRYFINDTIYNELCLGIISNLSKERFLRIIDKLANMGAQGIILGCTEIGLLIKQNDTPVRLFDTAAIHAIKAAQFSIDGQSI